MSILELSSQAIKFKTESLDYKVIDGISTVMDPIGMAVLTPSQQSLPRVLEFLLGTISK